MSNVVTYAAVRDWVQTQHPDALVDPASPFACLVNRYVRSTQDLAHAEESSVMVGTDIVIVRRTPTADSECYDMDRRLMFFIHDLIANTPELYAKWTMAAIKERMVP